MYGLTKKEQKRCFKSADIAPYFKTKQIFPLQKIIKTDKSGALTIESMVSQNIEAVRIIQQWLPGITVVSPKDLKEDMKKVITGGLMQNIGEEIAGEYLRVKELRLYTIQYPHRRNPGRNRRYRYQP